MKDIINIYDKLAPSYDKRYKSRIHFVEEEIIATYMPPINGSQKILDVGCGTGHMITVRQIKANQYKGVDISSHMVEIAKSKYHGYDIENLDGRYAIDEAEFDVCLYVFGQINYMTVEGWLESICTNMVQSGRFFAVMYSDEYKPDYLDVPNKGSGPVFPTLDVLELCMKEHDLHYYIHGLSFPIMGDEHMSFDDLLYKQTLMTQSGFLSGCKYWMIEGGFKKSKNPKPPLRLVK